MTPFADLHYLWLRQLQREFDDVCFQYGINLKPPVFEISRSRKQLGSWHGVERVLRISYYLITEQPWNVTLQVLKHEMAHQVCSELFGCKRAGHGTEFRKACELLGVPKSFARAQGDVAGNIDALLSSSRQTTQGRQVIDKVRKLLALAGSDNEHEAALAMQRAGELLIRYNLEWIKQDAAGGYAHVIINTGAKRMASYRRAICAILRDYFFVQVICSSLYDPHSDTTHKTIELLGREENVPVAEHCYHFLEDRLASLWQENRHSFSGNARTARNSYYLGLLHGFAGKLASQSTFNNSPKQENTAFPPGALILGQDAYLRNFVDKRFPRLRKARSRGARIYRDTYREAVATGRSIVLHRAMEETRKRHGGLLE